MGASVYCLHYGIAPPGVTITPVCALSCVCVHYHTYVCVVRVWQELLESIKKRAAAQVDDLWQRVLPDVK